MTPPERSIAEATLVLPAGDGSDDARVRALRAAGVPEDVVAACAAARRTDRIVERARHRHPHAFIAAVPHAGGPWLRDAMARAGGLADVPLADPDADDEPALARRCLPDFLAGPSIALHAARATRAHASLLERLGVRPVVLVRRADEVLRLAARDPGVPILPGPDDGAMSAAARLELAVRVLGPRLLSFHASWDDAAVRLPLLRLDHAALVAAPADAVCAALAHAGIATTEARVADTVAALGPPPATPAGPALPARLRAALDDLAARFADDHDLAPLGLDRSA